MEINRKNKLLMGLGVTVVILLAKLFAIQIVEDKYKRSSENNSMVYNDIYPPRGIIYDRHGNVLVNNKICYDIMVTPHDVKEFEDIESIAANYKVSVEDILKANNLKSRKLKTRQTLKIPASERIEKEEEAPVIPDQVTPETEPESQKSTIVEDIVDLFTRKNEVNAVLMLPLNAGGTPSGNNMDFYCGFLMGVRDLGEKGISTDLSVYDVSYVHVRCSPHTPLYTVAYMPVPFSRKNATKSIQKTFFFFIICRFKKIVLILQSKSCFEIWCKGTAFF